MGPRYMLNHLYAGVEEYVKMHLHLISSLSYDMMQIVGHI